MSDQPDEPSASSSSWHSIRPWTPHLILTVREITSVSATFILSSSLSTPTEDISPPIAEDIPEHDHHDLESSIDPTDLPEAADSTLDATTRGIIADALSGSKGLSVSVNGSPWQRVLIRLHDPLDEAVIIIYGLMPGRQYDIDLGLVQGGQASNIRRQVITEGYYPQLILISCSKTYHVEIQKQRDLQKMVIWKKGPALASSSRHRRHRQHRHQ